MIKYRGTRKQLKKLKIILRQSYLQYLIKTMGIIELNKKGQKGFLDMWSRLCNMKSAGSGT